MPYRPDRPASENQKRHRGWLWLVLVVVILAIAGWLYNRFGLSSAPVQQTTAVAPAAAASTHLAQPAPVANPTAPRYPVPTAGAPAAAATAPQATAKEEPSFVEALKRVLGVSSASANGVALSSLPSVLLPIPEGLVTRIVATVDALGRNGPIPVRIRPVPAPTSLPNVNRQGAELTWSDTNAVRYQPFVDTLDHTDIHALVRVYFHYYQLFQQAYEKLGFPNGYFNDRLVQVVDLMIATPPTPTPIELTQPHVLYQFADPALEALPAGQKLMMRIGPQNEALARAKLRELRSALASGHPAR